MYVLILGPGHLRRCGPCIILWYQGFISHSEKLCKERNSAFDNPVYGPRKWTVLVCNWKHRSELCFSTAKIMLSEIYLCFIL
jgi:hypothetical protein